jgi:hypothetical protein
MATTPRHDSPTSIRWSPVPAAAEVGWIPGCGWLGASTGQVPDDLIEDAQVVGAAAEVPVAEQPVQTICDPEEEHDDADRRTLGARATAGES